MRLSLVHSLLFWLSFRTTANAFAPLYNHHFKETHQQQTNRQHGLCSATEKEINTKQTTSNLGEICRKDFAILHNHNQNQDKPLVYLDSGATAQKPEHVLQVMDDYYRYANANVHRGAHALSRNATAQYEAARDKVAQFVKANSRNEVVFTSGATEAINLVVQSYGRNNLQAGDEIILTVAEHHSNLVPWQLLAQEKNLTLRFIPLDPNTQLLDLKVFQTLLCKEKTKVVAFQHVSNVLSTVNPVQEMVQMVKEHAHPNAVVLLDACQSLPHMPINVQDLQVDFLVASGHKLCGPTGIGFLWGKEQLLNDKMPPWKGGGEMIDTVTLHNSTWLDAPARFEAGTPAIAQAIGLGAALDYLESIGGMQAVQDYEHELAVYLYQQLQTVPGLRLLGPSSLEHRAAALCAFAHPSVHPSDLSSFLDMDGIAIRAGHHCCQPLHHELNLSHSARASCYIYNTKDDVDALVVSLKNTIQFFEGLEASDGESSDKDDFVPFV